MINRADNIHIGLEKVAVRKSIKDLVIGHPELSALVKRMEEPADFRSARIRRGAKKLPEHKEFPLSANPQQISKTIREAIPYPPDFRVGKDEVGELEWNRLFNENYAVRRKVEENRDKVESYIKGRRTASDLRRASELLKSDVRGIRPTVSKRGANPLVGDAENEMDLVGLFGDRGQGVHITPKKRNIFEKGLKPATWDGRSSTALFERARKGLPLGSPKSHHKSPSPETIERLGKERANRLHNADMAMSHGPEREARNIENIYRSRQLSERDRSTVMDRVDRAYHRLKHAKPLESMPTPTATRKITRQKPKASKGSNVVDITQYLRDKNR
jgi:hypothetical protein